MAISYLLAGQAIVKQIRLNIEAVEDSSPNLLHCGSIKLRQAFRKACLISR